MKAWITEYARTNPTEMVAYAGTVLIMIGTAINTDIATALTAGGALLLVISLIKAAQM